MPRSYETAPFNETHGFFGGISPHSMGTVKKGLFSMNGGWEYNNEAYLNDG